MRTTKLLLIITFMVFSTGNIFAQNNDMKARMEFEDAETAYSNQNYSKTVEHLENAEKFLGKATAKTRYLLILSLSKNLSSDYEYKDLEKLRTLCKHYLDNYTTDIEKYRDIYDLSNNLNKNYPKSFEEYNKLKQEQEEQQKRLAIENKERERASIAAIERNRNNFLNYKLASFYEDGKDIKSFTAYNFSGKFSYKDKVTKKKYYIYPIDYDTSGKFYSDGSLSFMFNENKLSYEHRKTYWGYPTTSQIEKKLTTFLQNMKSFSEKYNLIPEITKDNSNGENITYKFSYKNKTVNFLFSKRNDKGKLVYVETITVTNHNYENK